MDDAAEIRLRELPRLLADERARRLSLGFDYDFGDERGVHRIGTTESDMRGWQEVTFSAQAALALGNGEAVLTTVVTDTGPVEVTALEWMAVLDAARVARQPIWHASFAIASMDPPPADVADDALWPLSE